MKVCVFGAGYVGLVTAVCLAEMGNSVVCLDLDEARIDGLQQGEVPIHEPGLEALLLRNAAVGRLRFTTDAALAVAHGTLIFIAVGTPPAEDGSADLDHVLGAARTIGQHMLDFKVVVDKSTVPVGTAELVRAAIGDVLRHRSVVLPFAVVSNPEFLKEGAAIEDFMRPDRVVIGCDSEQAAFVMRALYAPFLRNRDRMLVMDIASAELTKYAANAMLATRISFMNELAALAEVLGADIEQVRRGIGSDARIGTHFLYAGCGWGGSCLPKDVKALAHMAEQVGVAMPMLAATRKINEVQRHLLVARLRQRYGDDLRGHRIAIWGLAFKPGTDDLREAPSLDVVDALLLLGAEVCAYDPVAMANAGRRWAGQAGFHLAPDPMACAEAASALLVLTEWREFRSPDFVDLRSRMRHAVILDGRNLYDADFLAGLGFDYQGIGRGRSGQPGWLAELSPNTRLAVA